jgi:hypothetical protein
MRRRRKRRGRRRRRLLLLLLLLLGGGGGRGGQEAVVGYQNKMNSTLQYKIRISANKSNHNSMTHAEKLLFHELCNVAKLHNSHIADK